MSFLVRGRFHTHIAVSGLSALKNTWHPSPHHHATYGIHCLRGETAERGGQRPGGLAVKTKEGQKDFPTQGTSELFIIVIASRPTPHPWEGEDVGNPGFSRVHPLFEFLGCIWRIVTHSTNLLMPKHDFQKDKNITYSNKVSSVKYLFTALMGEPEKGWGWFKKNWKKIKGFIVTHGEESRIKMLNLKQN